MISSKSPDLEDQFCRTKRAVDHEVSKGVVDLLEELLQDLDDVAVAVEAAERHVEEVALRHAVLAGGDDPRHLNRRSAAARRADEQPIFQTDFLRKF